MLNCNTVRIKTLTNKQGKIHNGSRQANGEGFKFHLKKFGQAATPVKKFMFTLLKFCAVT
jgi:hypothetical protein